MTMRNGWIWVLAIAAAGARAEPVRPFLTLENRLPEARQLEAEVSVEYRDVKDFVGNETRWVAEPRVRYGLARDLAATLAVPVVRREPAYENARHGMGDVRVGLQLRAWEHAFGFPYFIPYAEANLATGDEEKGFGSENASVVFGAAIGTTVYESLHYALDVRYRILKDESNVVSARGALIYDLGRKTSILVEGEVIEKRFPEPEARQLLLGGFTYMPAHNWLLGFYGGGYLKEYDDVVVGFRLSYSFRPFAPFIY